MHLYPALVSPGDLGGLLGLLLGGSVLSIIEVLDFCIYSAYLRHHRTRSSDSSSSIDDESLQNTGSSLSGVEVSVKSSDNSNYD